MRMTNETLGTRGLEEDGSDDINSYFHKVVDKIPASSNSSVQVSGINSLLSERKSELGLSVNLATVTSGTNVATIKSEIDANRPIIISMHSSNSSNHAVVGYGYQTLGGSGTKEDGQFGYIVHYGWADTLDWTYKSNVWINQAWCYSWVRMVVAHTTHTYGSARVHFMSVNVQLVGTKPRIILLLPICLMDKYR